MQSRDQRYLIGYHRSMLAMLACLIVPFFQPANMNERLAADLKHVRGVVGVFARDLNRGEEIAVNADARFPTASTIKTAVMVEAYAQAAAGRLPMDAIVPLRAEDKVGGSGVLNRMHDGLALTVADLLHLMIALSDNTATNMLIGRVGTAKVNERLESFGLRETKLFRPTFRDGRADVLPELEREFGLGMTTPREMGRLMALIAEGKAVNAGASAAMFDTLGRQQDRAMIPRLLPQDAKLQVGNKTGTDAEKQPMANGVRGQVRADAAIVTGPNVRYVMAIYARQVEDQRSGIENEAVTAGARIARMVHDYFTRQR